MNSQLRYPNPMWLVGVACLIGLDHLRAGLRILRRAETQISHGSGAVADAQPLGNAVALVDTVVFGVAKIDERLDCLHRRASDGQERGQLGPHVREK